MKYAKVFITALGYELAPVVVTSAELEARLEPLYRTLHIAPGQLQALTGIRERRWWEPGYPLSQGAVAAGKKALAAAGVSPADIGVLIYAGVCREQFEPATACRVAAGLGISGDTTVFDISNACLGRPQRHHRRGQPDRARPDQGRPGGLLRERPRDQRHHDRPDARGTARWTLRRLAGHPDRRFRRGGGPLTDGSFLLPGGAACLAA